MIGPEMEFRFKPIGVIHTPFKTRRETPRQGFLTKEVGEVEIYDRYEKGLKDIEGFSHLILIWMFHEFRGRPLIVTPPHHPEPKPRGVFATRSPDRPNPIGVTIVKLLERRGNRLKIQGIDMLDGTPLLDIKPYVPDLDRPKRVKTGWMKGKVR